MEIAHFPVPDFEGLGHAAAMARETIGVAGTTWKLRRVLAHTLRDRGAPTHVLETVGTTGVGDVEDPEDGRAWGWELATAGTAEGVEGTEGPSPDGR